MAELLWDASALAKAYAPEIGTGTVRALFAAAPTVSMATTYLGYAETCASLRRKFNDGTFNRATFTAARSLFRVEVLIQPGFRLITLDDQAIMGGIPLGDRYNLNASDAAILFAYLRYAGTQTAPVCVLVAADQRLLRAATSEGLKSVDPEGLPAADVPTFIASL